MSDVELGGATVFPLVGARIKATKVRTEPGQFALCDDVVCDCSQGDAAFWWNLKMSGEGDMLTRHAGCPVLVGSKWGVFFIHV